MKVALYARKSKGQPTEVQLSRLRQAALAEGHEVVLERMDIATGSNPYRPGWEDIETAVKAGAVRSVWITKTDRAMRSALHYHTFVDKVLAPRKCQLRVLDQPLACVGDYDDPLAKAVRGIGAVFAQLEVDLADERSNEGHEQRDGRWYGPSGIPVGRPVKFGPDHKFRVRDGGRREHDRARCPACRGETGGQSATLSGDAESEGVGEPTGFPTPRVAAGETGPRIDRSESSGAQ